MNLSEYKDPSKDEVLVIKSGESTKVTLPVIKTKSDPISIDIEVTPLGTSVSYSLLNAIPETAIIAASNIVFYGEIQGVKRIANAINSISGTLIIDSKYSNPSMSIQVEMEDNKKIYQIKDEVLLDSSKTISLSIQEPETTYTDQNALIQEMVKRISRLENRISILEQKG